MPACADGTVLVLSPGHEMGQGVLHQISVYGQSSDTGLPARADGTVLVLSPGHEMGQGLFTKVRQSAAMALSEALPPAQRPFPIELITVADNASDLLPNAGAHTSGPAACVALNPGHDTCMLIHNVEPCFSSTSSTSRTVRRTCCVVHAHTDMSRHILLQMEHSRPDDTTCFLFKHSRSVSM